jgi:cytochrome c oxidase subunit IV
MAFSLLWPKKVDGLLWPKSAKADYQREQHGMKLFLLVAGVFLIPVALSYGVDPA